MQNVSRIQKHPDTLIKNFFIAGLSQRTLRDDIFPQDKKQRELFNLDPEMLFSLYEEPELMTLYLQQVFPDKVSILQTEKMVDPKFFSFMSVDQYGFNQYNHCLIFYERFQPDLIREDFDAFAHVEKLTHQMARIKDKNKRRVQPQEEEHFGNKGNLSKAEQLNQRVQLPTSLLEAKKEGDHADVEQALFTNINALNSMRNTQKNSLALRKGLSTQQPSLSRGPTNNSNNRLESVAETQEEHYPNSMQNSKAHFLKDDSAYRDNLYGQTRGEAFPDNGAKNGTSFYTKKIHVERQQAPAQLERIDTNDSLKTEINSPATRASQRFGLTVRSEGDERASTSRASKVGGEEFYFAPIAFVIQTEVEHHDIFKDVMLMLFESIRQPIPVTKDEQKDQQLAYAEFLAHLAFLVSIPCPTFNTRFHIEFFNRTLKLTEPNFDEIPDKNQIALRVLFEMLDVRTILYCWKAILFDHTLVLISSQYSLQFYIAQALLQLVFPLTFQYAYVQPASSGRIGMIQSPFPILFTCSPLMQHFDNFAELKKDNIAICDIDGSFTNNLPFPELEDEKRQLRLLSALKNFKGARYDSAFKEMYQKDLQKSNENFTKEVRSVFFGMLDLFLNPLIDGEYFKKPDEDQLLTFINYFDEDQYLAWFEGTKNFEFAKKLKDTQPFATFCDSFFDKDVSNMLIYLNISKNGFDFEAADNLDPSMKIKFEKRMQKVQKMVLEQGEMQLGIAKDKKKQQNLYSSSEASKKNILDWPKQQKVDICWRMPQDNQRVMIFENLEYSIKFFDNERQIMQRTSDKKACIDNDYLLQAEQNHAQEMQRLFKLIDTIKELYAKKLPVYAEQLARANKNLISTSATELTTDNQNEALKLPLQMQKTQSLKVSPTPGEFDRNQLVSNSQETPPGKLVNGLSKQKLVQSQREGGQSLEISDDQVVCEKSQSSGLTPRDTPFQITPRQKKPKHFFNKQESAEVLFESTGQESEDKSTTEEQDVKKQFWDLRQQYRSRFCKNRIVELCYGSNGLIDFLDKLFTQFPNRRYVKNKFNYYFAIRKQMQAIEQQIISSLQETQRQDYKNWYKKYAVLLDSLIPQLEARIRNVPQENTSGTFAQPQEDLQKLASETSISFSDLGSGPQLQIVKIPSVLSLRQSTSIVFKGISKVEIKQNASTKKEEESEQMLDMLQPEKYSPLEVKDGQLNVFGRDDIVKNVWFLPVIPDKVEIEVDSGRNMTDLEKLVAFRTSYQYISLKQKLFFAFEDQEEAISMIFGEFLLFPKDARQIFPTQRFYELLELMTEGQKSRIFQRIVETNQNDLNIFQLRLMFEHEILGMDADSDEPASLDHTAFDRDFLAPERPPKSRLAQLGKSANVEPPKVVAPVPLRVPTSPPAPNVHIQTLETSQSEVFDKKRASNYSQLDVEKFNESFGSSMNNVVPNPDKKVKKLLEELLQIYMEAFNSKYFCEDKEEIVKKEIVPVLLAKLQKLRESEQEKLTKREIFFDQMLKCAEAQEETDNIKRCFWLNLINFKLLQKLLEIFLVKPSVLKKQLTNCTMFITLMASVKVTLLGCELSCWEIFKSILKHDDITILTGAFDEPYRAFEDLPEELQKLAPMNKHATTQYGLFLPITKWAPFTVFEKANFEEQLLEVVYSHNEKLLLNTNNFIQRLPKHFFWKKSLRRQDCGQEAKETQDVVELLQQMLDHNIFRPGSQQDAIKTVLNQIRAEQASQGTSAHLFEIDRFCWRFDLLHLRAQLRAYCRSKGIWMPTTSSAVHSLWEPFREAKEEAKGK